MIPENTTKEKIRNHFDKNSNLYFICFAVVMLCVLFYGVGYYHCTSGQVLECNNLIKENMRNCRGVVNENIINSFDTSNFTLHEVNIDG